MREIKFDYILQHDEMGLITHQSFTMEEIEGSNFLVQLKEKFRRYNIVARRQSTGLLDKNRKEIYEGDKIRFSLSWNAKPICTDYITYSESKAWFSLKNRGYCMQACYNIEVIGSIYENPDLLTNN